MTDEKKDIKPEVPFAARIKTWLWTLAVLVSIGTAATGGAMHFLQKIEPSAPIQEFGIKPKHGLSGDAQNIRSIVSKQDFFLKILRKDGRTLTTIFFQDVPVGNGLNWDTPDPGMRMTDIKEIQLYDRNFSLFGMKIIKDKMVDRVEVNSEAAELDGQVFTFMFTVSIPEKKLIDHLPMILMIAGGGLFGFVTIAFLMKHAI